MSIKQLFRLYLINECTGCLHVYLILGNKKIDGERSRELRFACIIPVEIFFNLENLRFFSTKSDKSVSFQKIRDFCNKIGFLT